MKRHRRELFYSGDTSGSVIAYDVEAQEMLWRHEEHENSVISVFYADGVVYSSGLDNEVMAYDIGAEEKLWGHEKHDRNVLSVHYADGVVYSGGVDDKVIAVEQLRGVEDVHEGEFTWSTEGVSTGEYELKVESEDDEQEVKVTVLEPPHFEIDIIDHDTEVKEGDELVVEYRVTNTGGAEGIQWINLQIGDDVEDNTRVTIGVNEEYEDEFVWKTTEGDAGEYELKVVTEDDEETISVTVEEESTLLSYWWMFLILAIVVVVVAALVMWKKKGSAEEGYMDGQQSSPPPSGGQYAPRERGFEGPQSVERRDEGITGERGDGEARFCSHCNSRLRWIGEYNRWYCDQCEQYR